MSGLLRALHCLFVVTVTVVAAPSTRAQDFSGTEADPPPGWNRAIGSVEITPLFSRPGFMIDATISVEVLTASRAGLDMSMEVFFLLNGSTIFSTPRDVFFEPNAGEGCEDRPCDGTVCGLIRLESTTEAVTCRESDTCQDSPAGCDCRCGTSFVVRGPTVPTLNPGDEIMVLLRPTAGTPTEEFTPDDQLVRPIFRRGSSGDFNGDGMVSEEDYRLWSACMTGPDVRVPPECTPGDIIADNRVDLHDAAAMQLGFTAIIEPCSASSLRFYWPLPSVDARDWVINNYVDLDPSSGLLDFMGNAKTYDGHKGIDVDVPTFRHMDNDFPVYAAAAGFVVFTRDTEFDRNTSCTGTWNVVKIEHANGFKSIYGHMKKDSVVVSNGQYVLPGQKLGVVGSSGCSTHPHLHFEVHDCDDNVVAPFLNNMWLNPPVYNTPLGFMDAVLQEGQVTNVGQIKDPVPNVTLMAPGDQLGVGMSMGGGQNGDSFSVTLEKPDGSDFSTMTWNMGQVYRHSFWWNDRTLPNDNSALGFWKARVRTNGSLARTYTFGVSTLSGNSFQQVRHGIPKAAYQNEFNNITAAGYRPVWVDGYQVNGSTYFNAIFDKSNVAGWSARHGLSGSAYQDWFDDIADAGMRLVHVDSYRDGGSVRYAAIAAWDGGPTWAAYHGRTVSDHQALFNSLTGQGFRAVVISLVEISGVSYVTALYDKKNVGGWVALAHLTSAQYQAEFVNQANAGRRLAYFNGYQRNGVANFTAIWDSTSYSSWVGRHDQTAQQFQAEFDLRSGQGFLTRIVTGYENNNVANFGGFWIKN